MISIHKNNRILLKHKLLTAHEKKKAILKEIAEIKEQLKENYKDSMNKKQISSAKRLTAIRKDDINLIRKLKAEKKSKEDIKASLEKAKEARKKKQ